MKEFFLVLVGGLCSAIGGCIAVWYQAKKARQIRMEEVRGEQQLEACKKALSLTDLIQTRLGQGAFDDVLKILYDSGEWFSMNQILLPHVFVENWRSIRLSLRQTNRKEKMLEKINEELKRDKIIKELEGIENFIQNLSDEAEKSIRKELKLQEVKIRSWQE